MISSLSYAGGSNSDYSEICGRPVTSSERELRCNRVAVVRARHSVPVQPTRTLITSWIATPPNLGGVSTAYQKVGQNQSTLT